MRTILLALLTGNCTGFQPAEVEPLPADVERLVVLGDSISAGVGAASPYYGYAERLHRSLDAGPFPGLTFESHAVGGSDTFEVLEDQVPLADSGPTTIVVMTVGANDLLNAVQTGEDLAVAAGWATLNLADTITELRDGNTWVYVANVYDPRYGDPDYPRLLNESYALTAADYGATLVDVASAISEDPEGLLRDAPDIHPNGAGHNAIRLAFEAALAPALEP